MFAVRRFEPSEQDSVRRTNARSKRSSVSTATDGDDALLASAVEAAPPRKSAGTAQSSESQAETIEDEERRRLKEAKHEKRRARSRPQSSAADEQEPATGAGSEQQQGVDASSSKSGGDPLSVVDLKALLSLKNSTRRKELKPAAAAVSEEVNVPAVHTWRVMGQRKKDPDTRAAERAARRRARREDGSERGEHAEDDAQFASSSPAAAAVTDDRKERAEHSRKRAKTEQHPSSASLPSSALLPPSLDPQTAPTADEGAEREQKKPVERPDWMLRGVHIDPNASCPTAAFALHPALLSTLQSAGITSFFPVQATVIPLVLRTRGAHDLCVSSPTGSGKTLIYILPLLHALSQRKIVRLRAVVLVPSRGLAQQVGREMEAYARGVGVKVAVSVGGGSFKREQEALVRRRETRDSELIDYREAFHRSRGLDEGAEDEYESAVDVLVTTPGRLVDHLDGTPGFTLRHLHFFVVDEVDRLLTQHYHDWTQRVWLAMQPSPAPASSDSPAGSTALELRPSAPVQCQKLLLSATLTSHPAKLASLHLHNPVLFTDSQSRQKRYTIPAGLSASFILSDASEKPLLLLHLLSSLHLARSASSSSSSKAAHPSRDAGEQVLVFTSSVDGCHRVARLLALWGGFRSAEYSSLLSQKQRDALLAAFRRRDVAVLVCSDVMSRGMDISGVTTVINYDIPLYVQTYVHRVGRTARAGGQGAAITLVQRREYRWFVAMARRAANSFMERRTVERAALETMEPRYRAVIRHLGDVVRRERLGTLGRTDKLEPVKDDDVDLSRAAAKDEEDGADGMEEEEEGVDAAEWTFQGLKQGRPSERPTRSSHRAGQRGGHQQ